MLLQEERQRETGTNTLREKTMSVNTQTDVIENIHRKQLSCNADECFYNTKSWGEYSDLFKSQLSGNLQGP